MLRRELVYFCLDLLKLISDDAYITEEHVSFIADKVRAFILQLRYADIKKEVPESNYLTICLKLMLVPAISGVPCEGGTYLKSQEKIPTTMSIGNTSIHTLDYFNGDVTYVSRERMKYVGNNKWLKNIIYASLGPDQYLYFKSANPLFLYLDEVRMTGIFEDTDKAAELQCEEDSTESGDSSSCDPMDKLFPLEEGLVPTVIEMVVKYLSGVAYKPKDVINDAADNLSDLATFLRKNLKSSMQKQIENGE